MGAFVLLSVSAWVGGILFGGHKSHARNTEGVYSIGVHICGSLTCPDVVIREGSCEGVEHATMQYGVCLCEDGYHVENDHCVSKEDPEDCPEHADCSSGEVICYDGYYLKENTCLACPEHAQCSENVITCDEKFYLKEEECFACPEHAKACDNEGKATECLGGYTGEECETKIICVHGEWSETGCTCASGWYGKSCDFDCDGFKDLAGTCIKCNEPQAYSAQPDPFECEGRCPERLYYAGYCMMRCTDTQYRDYNYFCHDCTDPDGNPVNEKSECEERCPNREQDIGICWIKCDIEQFRGSDGKCHDCTDPNDYFVYDREHCEERCPDRKYDGSMCFLEYHVIENDAGEPCPKDGYVCNYEAYNRVIMECANGNWKVAYYDGGEKSCARGCIDYKIHTYIEEACVDGELGN